MTFKPSKKRPTVSPEPDRPSRGRVENASLTPLELFPGLFERVSEAMIFEDPKEWVDVTFEEDPKVILDAYEKENPETWEALKNFVYKYFSRSTQAETDETPKSLITPQSLIDHIDTLWGQLTRSAHTASNIRSSVIELPHDYIVAGGRFDEMYYWDGYFAMLGFVDKNPNMIENMANNFAYLIQQYGYVPNGNRSYYLGRSQPPFFHCLTSLLSPGDHAKGYARYIRELHAEYAFWMHKDVNRGRCVKIKDGIYLNRYFDKYNTPREESYLFDLEAPKGADGLNADLFRHIRAAAESGWDFSSRWFGADLNMCSMRTTTILPVDLNAILYGLECAIASGEEYKNNERLAREFKERARVRYEAINAFFWNDSVGFFCDYDLKKCRVRSAITCAGFFPLFFGCASAEQADSVAEVAERELLQRGGLVATTKQTEHQWDWPNGWAPLHWIAIQGLRRYGHEKLANEIKKRWLNTVQARFDKTGKFYEKYNVIDDALAGGGEYVGQEGFGWTNGVTAALLREE